MPIDEPHLTFSEAEPRGLVIGAGRRCTYVVGQNGRDYARSKEKIVEADL